MAIDPRKVLVAMVVKDFADRIRRANQEYGEQFKMLGIPKQEIPGFALGLYAEAIALLQANKEQE